MNLVRSRGWGAIKPVLGAQVDWGHPLAQGLVFAALLNEQGGTPRELIGGARAATSGALWTPQGRDYTPAASAFDEWTVVGHWARAITNGFTVASGVRYATAGAAFAGFFVAHNSTRTEYGMQSWTGAGKTAVLVDDNPRATLTTDPPLGVDVTMFGGSDKLSGTAFIERFANGRREEIVTGAAPATSTAPAKFAIGTERTHGANFPGRISWAYAYNRPLTPDERRWLAVEPYALIAPPAPRIFYIELGESIVPVTGSAAISGTGAVSATGVRSRSGAGTISGTGAVSASGVRTRLGAAAVSGSGSVSASGTVTRSGSAAIAGTGTVTIAGVRTRLAEAAISGTGTIVAGGSTAVAGSGAILGTGTISATSLLALPACVVLTVTEPYGCTLTVSEPYTAILTLEEC